MYLENQNALNLKWKEDRIAIIVHLDYQSKWF